MAPSAQASLPWTRRRGCGISSLLLVVAVVRRRVLVVALLGAQEGPATRSACSSAGPAASAAPPASSRVLRPPRAPRWRSRGSATRRGGRPCSPRRAPRRARPGRPRSKTCLGQSDTQMPQALQSLWSTSTSWRALSCTSALPCRVMRLAPPLSSAERACAAKPSSPASRATAGASAAGRRLVERQDADALEEGAHREALREARSAAGRQHVVGAGGVVGEGGRGVTADEDGAGVAHPRQHAPASWTCSSRCSGAKALTRSTAAVTDGQSMTTTSTCRCRASAASRSISGTSASAKPAVERKHGAHGAGAVLGLRQHVRGDPGRVGLAVGDDQHLARPGQAVDGDAPHHLPLGLGHVDVARPDDDVAARHGRGAEGHRGDRLRAADRRRRR